MVAPSDQEVIMNQIIHYFALLFIVFVCAEIRNVLVYERPYSGEPIAIWDESTPASTSPPFPATNLSQ